MKNRIKLFTAVLTISLALFTGCGGSSDEELTITGEEVTEEAAEGETPEETAVPEEKAVETEEPVYVYVVGAVNSPGVYGFKPGTRLFDVIGRAGGFREDAAAESVNLAEVISDGSVIKVLTLEEYAGFQGSSMKAEPVAGEASEKGGLVNINTASLSELTSLNGIGESRAQAIISYREENGAFRDKEEIKNVSGIKDGLFNKIKDRITV